jgi:hypothetical protein
MFNFIELSNSDPRRRIIANPIMAEHTHNRFTRLTRRPELLPALEFPANRASSIWIPRFSTTFAWKGSIWHSVPIGYNAMNTPHFNNPNVTLGDSMFGLVTGADGSRALISD